MSPGRAIWRVRLLPSLELTESFTMPVQRRKTPRGESFSRNNTDPAGWQEMSLIDSNSFAAGGVRWQNKPLFCRRRGSHIEFRLPSLYVCTFILLAWLVRHLALASLAKC